MIEGKSIWHVRDGKKEYIMQPFDHHERGSNILLGIAAYHLYYMKGNCGSKWNKMIDNSILILTPSNVEFKEVVKIHDEEGLPKGFGWK